MKLFIIGGELDCFKTAEETWKEELENPALYWHNIDKFQREHPKLYWQVNENLRKKGVKNV
jgi:hypothetical protein